MDSRLSAPPAPPAYRDTYRAAVIGHTGRGGYGHGIDLAVTGLPGVSVVAVADPDDAGREGAKGRTGAPRAYADYRELLERETPELVAVGPRRPDEREATLQAAIRAGARAIFTEKPFARSLEEADRILAAAGERGTKIAVAHQNRAFPGARLAARLIAEGRIGRLRTMRGYGKQDARGGGQDLMVLGTHMLDLMRLFAGDARWCHARVLDGGEDATPAAVREGDEGVGPVAGDDLLAVYGFDAGVTGTYESGRADAPPAGAPGAGSDYFRLELCGSGGILSLWSSETAPVYLFPRPFALPNRAPEWEALPAPAPPRPAGVAPPPAGAGEMHRANQVLVCDLLAAVEEGRAPLSGGHDARAALEMILAVYESHIRAARIPLPLADRTHPLGRWTDGAPAGATAADPPGAPGGAPGGTPAEVGR